MTDLGIPIPTKQSPYYCVNCGAHHAPNPVTLPATAAEVAALRAAAASDLGMLSEKIDALIGHGHAVDKNTELLRDVVNKLCSRVDALEPSLRETDDHIQELADRIVALEDRLHRVVGYSSQQDRNTAECVGTLESRLSALEAKRKK